MSENLVKWRRSEERRNRPQGDDLPPEEARALRTLRNEAADRGTDLAHGGKGGLPPSLVLHVLRRDDYRCVCNADCESHAGRVCGSQKAVTMHHLGGIAKNRKLSKQGHHNTPKNIISICEPCHDVLHVNARERGDDSSQVTPEGDKGTDRDHGKPAAKE